MLLRAYLISEGQDSHTYNTPPGSGVQNGTRTLFPRVVDTRSCTNACGGASPSFSCMKSPFISGRQDGAVGPAQEHSGASSEAVLEGGRTMWSRCTPFPPLARRVRSPPKGGLRERTGPRAAHEAAEKKNAMCVIAQASEIPATGAGSLFRSARQTRPTHVDATARVLRGRVPHLHLQRSCPHRTTRRSAGRVRASRGGPRRESAELSFSSECCTTLTEETKRSVEQPAVLSLTSRYEPHVLLELPEAIRPGGRLSRLPRTPQSGEFRCPVTGRVRTGKPSVHLGGAQRARRNKPPHLRESERSPSIAPRPTRCGHHAWP